MLLKYPDEFAGEMFAIMSEEGQSKPVVEYDRQVLIMVEKNIRLTFDSAICASETNFNIFSKNLDLYPVFDADKVVFEVKHAGF